MDQNTPSIAMSPEARENQLIAKAYDLAEKRLNDGSATAQEVVHFLKLGSYKSRMEMDNLIAQNKLLLARTTQIEADQHRDELYNNAIKAMSIYSGHGSGDSDEELY